MSPVVAGLVLAWLVIAVLALAMAGMLRQLRDVQRVLRAARPGEDRAVAAPESVRPGVGEDLALILLASEHCAVCDMVAPAFAMVAATARDGVGFVLLAADPAEAERIGAHVDPARVRVVGDPVAYHRIDPGWLPALVLIDTDGLGLAAEPVGSAEALTTTADQFMGWRPAPAPVAVERRS